MFCFKLVLLTLFIVSVAFGQEVETEENVLVLTKVYKLFKVKGFKILG